MYLHLGNDVVIRTEDIIAMFDIDACALAVNVTDEENICMIAGTWSINEYIRKEAGSGRQCVLRAAEVLYRL